LAPKSNTERSASAWGPRDEKEDMLRKASRKGLKNDGSKKIGDDAKKPLKKKGSKNPNGEAKNGFRKNGKKNGRAKKKGEKKKELNTKKRGKNGKRNAFAKKGEGKDPTKTLAPNQGLGRREKRPVPEVKRDPRVPAKVRPLGPKPDDLVVPGRVLDPGPGLAKLCAPNLDHPVAFAGLALELDDRRGPVGGAEILLPGPGLAKRWVLNLDQVPARRNSRTGGGPSRVGRAGLNRFLRMGAGLGGKKVLMGD
jgi:hypothetical protein